MTLDELKLNYRRTFESDDVVIIIISEMIQFNNKVLSNFDRY